MERRELITAVGGGGLAGGIVGFATTAILGPSKERQPDFELVEFVGPNQIQFGNGVELDFTVRNTGSVSGEVALTFQTFSEQDPSIKFVGQSARPIDANDEKSGTFRHIPQSPGNQYYRIDGFKPLWKVTVQS